MSDSDKICVIDVGSSSIRVSVIDSNFNFVKIYATAFLPTTDADGVVEFEPTELRTKVLELCNNAIIDYGVPKGIGISNQRASAIVWNRSTGDPVFKGISWQDLRTVGECLALQNENFRLAPNVSASKFAYVLNQNPVLRDEDLCVGTIDSYVVYCLSHENNSKTGTHITDASNVALSGLVYTNPFEWNSDLLKKLDIPRHMLPVVTDSVGELAVASNLKGSPPILAILGDQQASLIGQSCVVAGDTKATFGTGSMLDQVIESKPSIYGQSSNGTIPVVAWATNGKLTWGLEAVMLSAGSNIQWLKDNLKLISTVEDANSVTCDYSQSSDVYFVPGLSGIGTPNWDFGATGAFFGLSLATDKNKIIVAVLDGIANMAADMRDAMIKDSKLLIETLKVDGKMVQNKVFCQLLANACEIPIEVSGVAEATTLGVAYLVYLQLGYLKSFSDIQSLYKPSQIIEPNGHSTREKWAEAKKRALKWIPELSEISF